jgi:hypothetical protein
MIVKEDDLENNKLSKKYCDLCDKPFEVGQSYEKITTHRKSKLIIHTECIKNGI